MGAGVYKPMRPYEQPTQSGLGQLLGTAGSIVGGIYGGPAGSAAGGMAGNAIGSAVAPGSKGDAPKNVTVDQGPDQNALQRRKEAMDNSELGQLRQSIDSLKYLPPEQQAGLADPLQKAYSMAKQKGYG